MTRLLRSWAAEVTPRRLGLGVGIAGLGLAALIVSPLSPNVGVGLDSSLVGTVLKVGVGFLVGLLGASLLLAAKPAHERPGARTTDRRADPGSADRVVGTEIAATIESLGYDGDSSRSGSRQLPRPKLRAELRVLAIEALVEQGHDRAAARRSLATGEWTDDPRAAAYLGSEAPPVPLRLRVHDWATGAGERRRAERAIEVVGDLAGLEVKP